MDGREFLKRLPAIREAARKAGYAIGVHGSMKRDFDLIAVPWTEDAVHPDELAQIVFEAAGGVMWARGKTAKEDLSYKPHGRRAYAFHLQAEVLHTKDYKQRSYVDLSVTARAAI